MILKLGTYKDINDVLNLQSKYHINSILDEDKIDGFITTAFSKKNLEDIIKEKGLFIARNNDNKLIAYIMAASWEFWSIWPMFKVMIKDLHNLKYKNKIITVENSYQYGPICIDKFMRNTSVLSKLFNFSAKEMSKRYSILITFINKTNTRSYEAHKRKLGLDVIKEFEFNNNEYYELAYDVNKNL